MRTIAVFLVCLAIASANEAFIQKSYAEMANAYRTQAAGLKNLPELVQRLPEVHKEAMELAMSGAESVKRQTVQCTASFASLVSVLASTPCQSFNATIVALADPAISDNDFAASVTAFCSPNQCLPQLRAAFFNLSIDCGIDLSVYAVGVFQMVASTRLICLKDGDLYCLPQVRATFNTLKALPTGQPLTAQTLDAVCTDCFIKFLSGAGIVGGASVANVLRLIYDFGLICLKGTTATGNSVYCALEAQTFAQGLVVPTTQSFAVTLNAACRTKCLAKYFIAAQSIVNPDLQSAKNASLLFSFLCSQNPDKNNAYCLTLFNIPSSNPCSTILVSCSNECRNFITSTISSAGCCFTNALTYTLIAGGYAESLVPLAKQTIAAQCQITLPEACSTTNWDTITLDLVIRNIRATHWIQHRAAYLEALKQDICQYFGCNTGTLTITADVTSSSANTVTVTVTWTDSNGNQVIAGVNVQNIPLGSINQQAGVSGTSDLTEPVSVQSGQVKSDSPAQSDTNAATATSTPAVVLALFSVILAIMSLF